MDKRECPYCGKLRESESPTIRICMNNGERFQGTLVEELSDWVVLKECQILEIRYKNVGGDAGVTWLECITPRDYQAQIGLGKVKFSKLQIAYMQTIEDKNLDNQL